MSELEINTKMRGYHEGDEPEAHGLSGVSPAPAKGLTAEKPPQSSYVREWSTNAPGTKGTTHDGVEYECSPRGEMIALNKPMSRRKRQRLGLEPR